MRSRFLVEISVSLPADMPEDDRAALFERERRRGEELKADGTIVDIWRIPGRQANVGIWQASSATELHQAITSLPVWRWTEVTVRPLADHPLTTSPEAPV